MTQPATAADKAALAERIHALAVASKPFQALAILLVHAVPAGDQRSLALQKLLEAKDCAVRAAV